MSEVVMVPISAKFFKEFREECEFNMSRQLTEAEVGFHMVRDLINRCGLHHLTLVDYYPESEVAPDMKIYLKS